MLGQLVGTDLLCPRLGREYSGTSLENAVTINTQGIQEWTIPSNGTYKIEAWGASGGEGDDPENDTRPGNGARMSGHFTLTGNHVLKILVGQLGWNWNFYEQ